MIDTQIIKQIESIKDSIKLIEEYGIDEIDVSFSTNVSQKYKREADGTQKEVYLPAKTEHVLSLKVDFLNLLLEMLNKKMDIHEFGREIDKALGLKPFQLLLVSNKIYSTNTISFSCSKNSCDFCYNMFTCESVGKGKNIAMFTLTSNSVITYFKNEEVDYFENSYKKKHTDYSSILFGKLLFKIVSDKFVLKGLPGGEK
jgi:hypothetical protein